MIRDYIKSINYLWRLYYLWSRYSIFLKESEYALTNVVEEVKIDTACFERYPV